MISPGLRQFVRFRLIEDSESRLWHRWTRRFELLPVLNGFHLPGIDPAACERWRRRPGGTGQLGPRGDQLELIVVDLDNVCRGAFHRRPAKRWTSSRHHFSYGL